MVSKVMFKSMSVDWATPPNIYDKLNQEFHFDFDPCPLRPVVDGLSMPWGKVNYVNPPYGRQINYWLEKGYQESRKGKTVVFLLPARDTTWFHDYGLKADEIRFIQGRLKFSEAKNKASFPSLILVYKGKTVPPSTAKKRRVTPCHS